MVKTGALGRVQDRLQSPDIISRLADSESGGEEKYVKKESWREGETRPWGRVGYLLYEMGQLDIQLQI